MMGPSEAQGNCSGILIQSAVVQLHRVVVQVDGVHELRVDITDHSLLQKHGQVRQDGILDGGNILCMHPIFASTSDEVLQKFRYKCYIKMYLQNDCMHIFYQYLSASFFFCYDFVASQGAIHSTHDDHDVRVVSSNPGLVMQSADVEVFARIRQASIMFLKNLVKAGEIQVDILFYSIVIIAYL